MLCPLCNNKLVDQHQGLYICPDGHGTLVTAKYLSDIEQSPGLNEANSSKLTDTKDQIICPHCSNAMYKVDYNSTKIIIDSCGSCQYRWLDSREVTKIKKYKPTISARDVLLIADVDEQIRQAKEREIKEANPRLPLQGSYRAGSELVTGLNSDHQVRLEAIAGQGLYGILRGLINSKTSRILTIVTLLIFAILFMIIFWDYRDILRSLY